ncbi:MAG: transglycosylase family protein [Acidimicrobiia bacterium]
MPVPPRQRIAAIALLASLLLAAALVPGRAGAQSIDGKRAEAAELATKLQDQARRIMGLDVQMRQAQDELDDAESAVSRAEAELAATVRRQDELKRRLVVQAQNAYAGGGSVGVLQYLLRTNSGDEVSRRAYLGIVTGLDRRVIGELRASREDLELLQGRLAAAHKRARSRAASLTEDRAALDRAIRAQRDVLARVNGELAGLISAEQARRDAEAARLAAASRPVPAAASAAPTGGGPVVTAAPMALSAPDGDTWACIRQLESGNNYASPGGGAYQFLDSTWHSLGYTGTASDHPPHVQDQAAVQLQARSGWSQWTTAPLCGKV